MNDNSLGSAGYEPIPGGNMSPAESSSPTTSMPVGNGGGVQMPSSEPGKLNEKDLDDIRKMAIEYGFERPDEQDDDEAEQNAQSDAAGGGNQDQEPEDSATDVDSVTGDDDSAAITADGKAEATDEPEVISVDEREAEGLKFRVKGQDGKERDVTLFELLQNEVPREKFIQYEAQVKTALQQSMEREKAAEDTIRYYRGFVEAATVPHEFIAQYLDNHVRNGNIPKALRDAIVGAFSDPDFGYRADDVKNKAMQMISQARLQEQAEAEVQQKRIERARSDMSLIKEKNGGKTLTEDQIKRLYEKMQQMQQERGYEFVAPLEAFLIYRDDILGNQNSNVRNISQSRRAIINSLKNKRSTVPAPGASANSTGRREPTLEELGREAELEIRRRLR